MTKLTGLVSVNSSLVSGYCSAYEMPLLCVVFASGCTVRTFVGMQDHFEAALQAERQILAGYFWNDPEKLGEVCRPVCHLSRPIWLSPALALPRCFKVLDPSDMILMLL